MKSINFSLFVAALITVSAQSHASPSVTLGRRSCVSAFGIQVPIAANDNQSPEKLDWPTYRERLESSTKHVSVSSSSAQKRFALRSIRHLVLNEDSLEWDQQFENVSVSLSTLETLGTEAAKPNSVSFHLELVDAILNIGRQNVKFEPTVVDAALERLREIASSRSTAPQTQQAALKGLNELRTLSN